MTTVRDRIRAVLHGAADYEPVLDALTVAPAAEVDPELLAVLDETCGRLWRDGWQPIELHRVVTRRGQVVHGHLVTDAVARHLQRFRPGTVDDRWLDQAAALEATAWWPGTGTYPAAFAGRWRLDRIAVLDAMLGLLTILSQLPAIEVLVPPPGTAPQTSARSGGTDTRLLTRVRALLAKAESTAYPAEAEAYTAKAQELVARHSIDAALLDALGSGPAVVPFARRIGIDHPYESEKASLLHAVARANRCRTVWSPELGFATVFGYDADIDAVDLLHASLLVQAQRAMAQTEPPGGKVGRARLKSFRQSFLVAFSVRIGQRLAAAASAAATATAAGQADLLPVLASRDEQVRETMHKLFPRTVRARGSRVDSDEGWESGRSAADSVALDSSPARG